MLTTGTPGTVIGMRRWQVLRPHVQDGVPLARAARDAGVAPRTAQRWLAAFRAGGLAALGRQPRADAGRLRTASELFHRLLPAGGVRAALLADPARTVLAALGSAVVCYLVNTALITAAVRLSSAEVSWRQMLLDRESLFIDLVEVCMSIAVLTAWSVSPAIVLVLLPPAVLLQRSLTYVQMRTAARTDAKTGLLNAAAWHQEAEREIVRATRDHRPLAVLMIDLDNFKAFNDNHGHLAGDQALAAVAHSLVGGLRVYDQLGRFGGEEFAVVLPSADQSEAGRVAERLRRAVAELAIPGAILTPGSPSRSVRRTWEPTASA